MWQKRQALAYVLARQALELLQRTKLNVTVVCQAWHAKNTRHIILGKRLMDDSSINDLIKQGTPFEWSPERDHNFEKLKEILTTQLILQYPNNKGKYEVETDASDTAIGGVLRIKQPGSTDFFPVCYESRKLTDTEQRYPIHDKELLAIYHCCKKWRCYLEGMPSIKVLTDHKSLV